LKRYLHAGSLFEAGPGFLDFLFIAQAVHHDVGAFAGERFSNGQPNA
jgi:hypothetical protein